MFCVQHKLQIKLFAVLKLQGFSCSRFTSYSLNFRNEPPQIGRSRWVFAHDKTHIIYRWYCELFCSAGLRFTHLFAHGRRILLVKNCTMSKTKIFISFVVLWFCYSLIFNSFSLIWLKQIQPENLFSAHMIYKIFNSNIRC